MSVVGPRPQLVRDMVFMTDEQLMRHTVKPGLTGLAQVSGRNAISWDDKFKYDIEYVESISFNTDLKIVLRTVKKVFAREGIGQGEHHPGNLYDVRADWLDKNEELKIEYQED